MENIELFCVSLGCNENLVDTGRILGLSNGLGLTFTGDKTETSVILINTCCLTGDIKEESINIILEMAWYREEGRCRVLIVVGCLAQRYKQEILDEIPEMNATLGATSYEEIAKVLEQALEGRDNTHITCFHGLEELSGAKARRVVIIGGYYASLKISEGCDKRCTYCITPYLREPYRNVPIEELAEEASQPAKDGVKELILAIQETAPYGKDIYGKESLPRSLHGLGEIPGVQWIRTQYCYPEEIMDELIEAIRTEEKVCHYLDIPIRHASDRILRRMGCRTDRAELIEWIGSLHRAMPNTVLRTTLISGFPGETESDHEELMDFANKMEFKRLGVSTYSVKEDVPVYSYPDQVPQELKEEHGGELMELQRGITFEHCEDMVGQVLMVLIEGRAVDGPVYVRRTYMDAPNVGGMTFVSTDTVFRLGQAGNDVELMSGDFVRAKATGVAEYNLTGEVYDESAQQTDDYKSVYDSFFCSRTAIRPWR